ncbi:MAG: bifunctional metallophosphatase/5'-nucleotidase [Steroidobacteraceae bacterium]
MRRSWLMLLLLAGCAAPGTRAPAPLVPGPPVPGPLVDVKLIAFNDLHGHLQVPGTATRIPAPQGGPDLQLPTGGVAWLAGRIEALRGENPRNAVVAGGDLIGASPLLSALLKHEPTLAALGEAGLEFSAVGNHEFDRGVDELLRLQGLNHFQYLAANVRYRSNGQLVFPAWGSKDIALPGGSKVTVAFVGAVLRDTPALVSGDGVAKVQFLDEADAVNAAVREIRARGIEAIILLIHEGGFTEQDRFDDLTCPGFRGPILGIVDRLDPAIDAIVSAHTHRAYVCRRNGRLVTSAGSEGRMVTDIDLAIDPATGDVRSARARQLAVVNDSRENPLPAQFPLVPADARVMQQVAEWSASIAPLANRVVGSVQAPMQRAPDDNGESIVGDLIADAQLEATAEPTRGGAQIAITNQGGVRADLAPANGQMTYEQVFAVHPFGNFLVTMSLTGGEIKALLENQWRGGDRLVQVSRGLKYKWTASRPQDERIAPGDLLLHGQPLQLDQMYRVTVNDFLATSDNFTVLRQGRDRLAGPVDVEVLESYLARHSPVAPPATGRVTKLP